MNKKGFSLIELMIAVSIVAIVATMAVPSYRRMQSRARQKEAYNLAATYYSAAQSTFTEFGVYPGDFVQTGFRPQGEVRYRVRGINGTLIPGVPNDDACEGTNNSMACTCGGTCAFKTWTEVVGSPGSRIGAWSCNWGLPPCGPPDTTDTSFNILLCGVISTQSGLWDQHQMNQNKRFTQCQDGG